MSTRTRVEGEKGIAVMVTALLLIPLMIFAAFGVDLASWYSRISYLQKSADAASLAGTVWMPDLTKATTRGVREPRAERHHRWPRLRHRPVRGHRRPREHRHRAAGHRHRPRRHPLLLAGARQRRPGPHPLRRGRVQPPDPAGQPAELLRRRRHHEPRRRPRPPTRVDLADPTTTTRPPAGPRRTPSYPLQRRHLGRAGLGRWRPPPPSTAPATPRVRPRCYWSVALHHGRRHHHRRRRPTTPRRGRPTNVPCNAFQRPAPRTGAGRARCRRRLATPAACYTDHGTGNRQCTWHERRPPAPLASNCALHERGERPDPAGACEACNIGYAGTQRALARPTGSCSSTQPLHADCTRHGQPALPLAGRRSRHHHRVDPDPTRSPPPRHRASGPDRGPGHGRHQR